MNQAIRPCPNCQVPLTTRCIKHQSIDHCGKCGGHFFDDGELEALNEVFEHYESVVLDEPELERVSQAEIDRIVHCPADDSPMTPEMFTGTTLDRCPKCDGIWLDGGELTALRLAEASIHDNLTLYIRLGS